MKYIDAEKLIAEIERLKSVLSDPLCSQGNILGPDWVAGGNTMLNKISSAIDSLQQEQPAQKKNCAGCPHCIDRKDQYGWHFKGCFGGPYNGKFIAEIDECPLKQEQPEIFDTVAFQKGVQEGRRLEREDVKSTIQSRIDEILGDAQPNPILRMELNEIIKKIEA